MQEDDTSLNYGEQDSNENLKWMTMHAKIRITTKQAGMNVYPAPYFMW